MNLHRCRWYHLCFTYNHTSFLIETFMDGKVVQNATYDVDRPVFGDFIGVGNGQAITESYSGVITQVTAECRDRQTRGWIFRLCASVLHKNV